MKKRILIVGLVLLFIFSSVVPISIGFEAKQSDIKELLLNRGNTLYVGGYGPNNYSKIQDAIDNSSDGDTVFVYDDKSPYYEKIVIYKIINLIGEDKNTTIIDAQKNGTPVKIVADNCSLSGFKIINCEDQISQKWGDAIIKIDKVENIIVKDNILNAGNVQTGDNIDYGALDLNSCKNCKIINNYIIQDKPENFTIGIALHDNSSYNTISGNDVSFYNFGLRTEGEGIDYFNSISNNHFHHNRFGISIGYGYWNGIQNNIIEYNSEVGINIQDSQYTTISSNYIQFNGGGEKFHCGIELMGDLSNDLNYVINNVILKNNPCGLQTEYSYRNLIVENNFINNYGVNGTPEEWWGNAYFHIQDSFINKDTYRGNYWSDSLGYFPKIIHGYLEVIPHFLIIKWINFDWFPAKEPYDI